MDELLVIDGLSVTSGCQKRVKTWCSRERWSPSVLLICWSWCLGTRGEQPAAYHQVILKVCYSTYMSPAGVCVLVVLVIFIRACMDYYKAGSRSNLHFYIMALIGHLAHK
jgi:hypothetical protein